MKNSKLLWAAFLVFLAGNVIGQETKRDSLFDSDWKFFRGKVDGAEKPGFDDKTWRNLDLPHDWSIEDLPVPDKSQIVPELMITQGAWSFAKGDDIAWKQPNFDASGWEKVMLPANWETHSNYTQDNVFGWYRREITIPDSMSGKDILLCIGKIDDADETYFNGQLIGKSGSFPPNFKTAWDVTRRYKVSKELIKKDHNIVAIRVFDELYGGGLSAAAKPHVISGPFDSEAICGYNTGYTIGGTGWYRKHFRLPKEMADKEVSILFDGVYMNADVWINGHHLGNHPYGYTAFGYELSKYLNFGDHDNVIAVEVKNEGITGRWYTGSGIYRHVSLSITNKIHVSQWGTFISTSNADSSWAKINIKTNINNYTAENVNIIMTYMILDENSKEVANKTLSTLLNKSVPSTINMNLVIQKPLLWSFETPKLYKAICEISRDGQVVDKAETPFGIRTIYYDSEKGMFLNGKHIKLKGGAMHENNGALGSIGNDRAEERKVELMKNVGFNAIRCGHNPPSTSFLNACDRLGMLVIDEAFDVWVTIGGDTRPDDYHLYFTDWWKTDITSMVMRDRNHPSIFTYSIGNQLSEGQDSIGIALAKQLAGVIRELDPTRAISSNIAMHGEERRNAPAVFWRDYDPIFATLDICGYSYQSSQYENDHLRLPDRIMFSSEIDPRHSFDNWMKAVDNDYVIGNFEWTAMDHFGEPALGWYGFNINPADLFPWKSSYSGDIDLCGFRRPRSYYRDILFKNGNKLSMFVFAPTHSFEGTGDSPWGWDDVKPSWTWPGYESKNMSVVAYSACDSVQLFLNNMLIGTTITSRKTEFKAYWEVPYEKGVLNVIGFINGKKIADCKLVTAEEPSKIKLTADRSDIKADGQDLSFVTLEIQDKNGTINPYAANLINFAIEGPGTIAGVCNSNPISNESFQQPYRKAYEGRCLVIIRSKKKAGQIILNASGKGLKSDKIVINTNEY